LYAIYIYVKTKLLQTQPLDIITYIKIYERTVEHNYYFSCAYSFIIRDSYFKSMKFCKEIGLIQCKILVTVFYG